MEGLAARLSIVDYDMRAAIHTGEIRATLARIGTPISPYDSMIAGQARSRGFILVTNNEREFKRVDGLQLDNWSKKGKKESDFINLLTEKLSALNGQELSFEVNQVSV